MRLLTSSILLSLTVIAASCSKNQYAQVEPDDLYFTHKDRKEAVGGTITTTAPAITSAEPVQTPTEYERSEYSDQHSPVFTTPAYGSPTIQQYGQQPYYDTSVNPDYLYEDNYADLEGTSSEYYDEEYAYQQPPVYESPQVNNYYYGMPANSYYPRNAWMRTSLFMSYRPVRYSSMYMYDPYYSYWSNPYDRWYTGYNAWCNPYNSYYGPYMSYNYIYSWGNGYNHYGSTYYGSQGNYDNTYYSNGTKVVTKPRQSRSQVSYEADKSNLPVKSRRADYVPASGNESGRVATSGTTTRTRTDGNTSYTRRGNSPTYYAGSADRSSTTVNRTSDNRTAVQNNRRNSPQRTRTVVVPTRTRTTYANNNGSGSREANTYSNNRSGVNRSSGTTNRQSSTTRYSTRTTNANRSSYGTRSSSGNSSNTSYRSRSNYNRSSGSSSSYTPTRSSSRSYSTPSRSSGSSSRSYTPSRSSSSRSSGTRSSGSSSSGRSSTRKN